jgi:hypothetical protein
MAKRAKVSTSEPAVAIEDEPAATTGGTSGTTLPSSESSPRCSPQRKYSNYFPLAGAGVNIFVADIVGCAGEEQQYEESLGATPDLPPPSVTPPRRSSPARACSDAPIIEEVPASVETANTGTSGPTPSTNVAGEG